MSFRTSAPDPFDNARRSLAKTGAPLTTIIIITCAVLFLVNYFAGGRLSLLLACLLDNSSVHPIWGFLTYPFITADFISVVFSCLWLWFMGGSLERSWGIQRFGLFALGVSLMTAVSIWLGTTLLHSEYALFGLWLPLAALTVAWATISPKQTVLLYMVLPVPAWALAAFTVGVVYFVDFGGQYLLGLFGLITPLASHYFVKGGFAGSGLSGGYASRGPDLRMTGGSRPMSLDGSRSRSGPFGWWQDMQERRRLRKLLKNSGFSDRDPKR